MDKPINYNKATTDKEEYEPHGYEEHWNRCVYAVSKPENIDGAIVVGYPYADY